MSTRYSPGASGPTCASPDQASSGPGRWIVANVASGINSPGRRSRHAVPGGASLPGTPGSYTGRMSGERPPTPSAVARQLRREAKFGCCKCGWPILQYHHIIPWASEHHFRPEDMMALCPNHHDEATEGAMLEPEQRRLKANPYNVRRGYASGLLRINQTECTIRCGGNLFKNPGALLSVDGQPLLSMRKGEGGNLEVSLVLHDENDNLLAEIHNNEWVSGNYRAFDIEARHLTLVIRQRERKINLRINCKRTPMLVAGDLWWRGSRLSLSPESMVAHPPGGERNRLTLRGTVFAEVGVHYNSHNQSLTVSTHSGLQLTFPAGPGDHQIAGLTIYDGVTDYSSPFPEGMPPELRK